MIATKDSRENPQPRGFSRWRLLPIAFVAGGLVAFFAFGLDHYLGFEALRDHRQTLLVWRSEHHVLSAVGYVLLYAPIVAFSIPGAVWMTIAGGFLFGLWAATGYVVVGATAGATALFLAARLGLGEAFRARAGPTVRKMEKGFRENALSYLLVLRLIPLFPFWLVNLVPAFLGVRLSTFVLGTFLGIIPGSFVYVLVGNGLAMIIDAGKQPDLGVIFEPEVLIPICGLVLLSLIPIAYKKLRRTKG
ncbi:MAG: TVP38/TMEM64 family protein [Rhodospirillales bacterium]|jgi:uncharacterized membrane protein YdjX (TVP38/TMEM64 family)|nr:TVP38/TMEM64 family protein [Rhodospirillales bacterium]